MAEILNAFGGAAQPQAAQRYVGQTPSEDTLPDAAQFKEDTLVWVMAEESFYKVNGSGDWEPVALGSGASSLDWSSILNRPDSFAPSAHAATHASGGTDPLTLTAAQVGLGNVANLKFNLAATSAPTSGDDSADGYAVGSVWVNTSPGGKVYLCQSAAVGAANWIDLTSGTIAAQPTLTGPRSALLDISALFTESSYTLNTDYTDFYLPGLAGDVTIVLPDMPSPGSGFVWSPTIEVEQDEEGGNSITWKDSNGDVVEFMDSTLALASGGSAVSLVVAWYSYAASRWLLSIVNTWTPEQEEGGGGGGGGGDDGLNVYDESGQTIGAAASGLTNVWRDDTWTIEEDDSFSEGDIRRVFIQEQPVDDEFHAAKVDAAGDAVTDVEVLALVRTGGTTNSYKNTIYVRGAGTEIAGGKQSYALSLLSGGTLRIIRTHANTTTEVASAAFAWTTDTEYWLRFKVEGTALKAKAWTYGDSEPGSWNIETTDDNLDSGWIGLGGYRSLGPNRYCYLAWRTDGEALPVPS